MHSFKFRKVACLSSDKRASTKGKLSVKEKLIKRLEQRFKEQQASLRFITIGSLAMALSACKNDTLVQGSDTDDTFGNTTSDDIFEGGLGNDIYSYFLSGTDRITDKGGNDELRVSVTTTEGDKIETSFMRSGDDLVVTQSGEGNSVTVEGAFIGRTTLEQLTLVYEDGVRPDLNVELSADNALNDLKASLSTIDISERLASKNFTDSGDETKISVGSSTQMSMLSADTKTSLGMGPFRESEFSSYQGEAYTVVVIDTGIDLDHNAFGPDSDGDGISDRILYSQDFSSDGDGTADDVNGHGSNVASIIGSSDENYLGVAPKVNLIALQGLSNSGGGSNSGVEDALQWVIENAENYNIVAVNMSLGEGNNSNKLEDHSAYHDELSIIKSKGIVTVVAAGNDYYKYQDTGPSPGVSAPANDPNVIPVGAVWQESIGRFFWAAGAKDFRTASDRVTSFSQRSTEVDVIFAQGALITGAAPGGGVDSQGGTSQATPFVAGMVAVAQNMADDLLGRRLTPDEFENMLRSSATTIYDGDDERDNVANLDTPLPRVNILALAQEIKKLAEIEGGPSQVVADDFNQGVDTNGTVEVGAQVTGNLEKATDDDWLEVDLTAGHVYGISVKGKVSSEGTLLDPLLSLYNQNGDLLVNNDDGGAETEPYIEFTPANDQSFYVSISSYGTDETGLGTYLLEVKDLGPALVDDFSSGASTKSILTFDERTGLASVNGSLEFLGDVDWHAVDLTGRNTYIVDVSGNGETALEDPYLKIFDIDGNLVVSNDDGGTNSDARLRFSPQEDGKYFIEASGYNNSLVGDYTVSLTEIDAKKDIQSNPSTNATVAMGESFSGLLEFEGDRDWIKADLIAGSVYNVTLEGDQAPATDDEQTLPLEDPYLRLFDGRSNLIAENDDLNGRDSGLTNLSVDTTGTYFLSAGAYGDSGIGNYILNLTEQIFSAEDIPSAIITQYEVTEDLTLSNFLEVRGDRDWIKATFETGKSYEINLYGSGVNPVSDTYLRLYDEQGNFITENDDGPEDTNSKVFYTPTTTGPHFLSVGSFNDEFTGSYTLSLVTLEIADDYPLTYNTEVFVTDDTPLSGVINSAGEEDFFKLVTNEQAFYEISLTSDFQNDTPLSDPLLMVFDEYGDMLAVNDDHGASLNSKLVLSSDAASTVYIVASGFDGVGGYTLNVTTLETGLVDDHLNDFSTTSQLIINNRFDDIPNGNLEYLDEADMFVVWLEEGEVYDFQVLGRSSTDKEEFLANPTLSLYDRNGSWLDYNDDGPQALDPLIYSFKAPYQGNYFLEVGQDDFLYGTGAYFVEVSDHAPIPDDHSDTLKDATLIQMNPSGHGEISGAITFTDPRDVFQLDLSPNTSYKISVLAEDFDSYLRFVSAAEHGDTENRIIWLENDDAVDFNGSELTVVILDHEDYFIEVSPYLPPYGGQYQIKIEKDLGDDHPNTPIGATLLQTNETVSGNIKSSDDFDFFTFAAEEGKAYEIQVSTEAADLTPFIRAVTVTDMELFSDARVLAAVEGTSLTVYSPSSQDIFINFSASRGSGDYDLIVRSDLSFDDHANHPKFATPIQIGEIAIGKLEEAWDWDTFEIVLGADRYYDIELNSSPTTGSYYDGFDSVLKLMFGTDLDYFSDFIFAAENDDSDMIVGSFIDNFYSDESRTYFIEVLPYSGLDMGPYELLVNDVTPV